MSGAKEEAAARKGGAGYLLPALGIWAVSRIMPLARFGLTGIGADIAAYHTNFERCFADFFSCAATPVALLAYLLHAAGIETDATVVGLSIAANAFLGWAIWLAAKHYFSPRAALWSAGIFALSMPQFVAWWSVFVNMEIALALALVAMVAYERRSKWSAAAAAIAGIVHPVTLAPLALAAAGMAISDRGRRRHALTLLVTAIAGTAAYRFPELRGYAENAAAYATGSYGTDRQLLFAGHFLNFSLYHDALMLFYIPFALMTIARSLSGGTAAFPALYATIALAMVMLHALFYNRFIIAFDVMAIAMAGQSAELFARRAASGAMGKALLIGTCAILGGYLLWQSVRMEPLMNRQEFEEIRSFSDRYPGLTIFVNDPTYRQFVEGYSGHETIAAPFAREPWRMRRMPALIYNARRSTPFLPRNDAHAEKISERFWKWSP